MLVKRIIPCLDVIDGRVVKGINYKDLEVVGEPRELALRYEREGADELVFLLIGEWSGSFAKRCGVVRKAASDLSIPLCVGGGIDSIEKINLLLRSGADKVALNKAAIEDKKFLESASMEFGSQCIVVSIDAKRKAKSTGNSWSVCSDMGSMERRLDAVKWAKRASELGAGEILVNSIDADGTRRGYDLGLLEKISESVRVPVIASSGAGKLRDFYEAFSVGGVDAALAAGVFHSEKFSVKQVKGYLKKRGIPVRA
jgi:cyclase